MPASPQRAAPGACFHGGAFWEAIGPGFDGLDPATGQKRITSMRVPHEQIGSAAVTRLVNRIQHPTAPRRKILVEAELVAGETIAKPVAPNP